MSSSFRQIRLLTTELAALERLTHQCLHFFSVGIDPILLKVGGYIDMQNLIKKKKKKKKKKEEDFCQNCIDGFGLFVVISICVEVIYVS